MNAWKPAENASPALPSTSADAPLQGSKNGMGADDAPLQDVKHALESLTPQDAAAWAARVEARLTGRWTDRLNRRQAHPQQRGTAKARPDL